MPGAQGEGQAESAEPLDPAAWPTPQPTAAQASPTPFPKITLAPTATPTPGPATPSAASPASHDVGGLTFTGDVSKLVQQVTSLSGGFPPAAAAIVVIDGVTVRQGPADSYPSIGETEQGEMVAVLGKNDVGDWLYVLTQADLQGWLPAETLQIAFALAEAPILPADPMAHKPAQVDSSAPITANPLGGLEPVAVALVTADSVAVRQGPATSYPSAGVVEQGELAAVLGTNAAQDWLYVVTISSVQGWLPANTVRITGSLAGAPVLPANPLAAPIAQTSPSPASASTTSAEDSQPLALSDLKPVTTARVDNEGLNMRQGPGATYEQLGTLSRNDEVVLLALNKTGDWALVKIADGQFGWVSLDYLAVDGSLTDAPQVISPAPSRSLPSGQVAPIFPAASTSGPTAAILNLTSLATARPNRADVDLYRGPGSTYLPIVSLSVDDTVFVLALSQGKDWALVRPADTYKSPGWVLLQDLTVDGSLANAPQVFTAWVESNALAVRRGPGLYYEQIGTLAINDLVAVVGVNAGGNWALIQPIMGGGQGWIPINFLNLTGSWADVPEAPAPALAATSTHSEQAAPDTSPVGTARPGKLVFQTSSGGDIMIINPDGTGLRRLTHGIDPVLSPDGDTLAFTRWTGEDGVLWLINVDGGDERPVIGGIKQAKHPAWSPDGQRIVVNFQQGGRLDPRQVCQNLIDLGDKEPDIPWNVDPDSIGVEIQGSIPFLCWTLPPDPHWGLRVVNVADGNFEDVPSDTYSFGPEWDPANPWRIASSGLNGLVQLDVNRGEQWELTDRSEDHTPAFSPDGRYIAIAFNNSGHFDIHRLNSDGSGRVPLTKTPLWVTAQPGDNKPWNNVSPAWSPDGSQIAFLTDRTGRWEIWAMNVDGSNQHPMFPDGVNDQLQIVYDFVDERVLSWR
jgi:uncharacterized protein YgiM (DUF1202 family)